MEKRWQEIIQNDPCYSPHLTKSRPDYSIVGVNDFNNKLLAISLSEDQASFWGCGIDYPQVGELFKPEKLEIKGWVMGKVSPVVEVQFIHEKQIIRQCSVNQLRTDIAQNFPQVTDAENSGFIATVEINSSSCFTELILFAILENNTKIPFATLHLQLSSSFLN